MKVVKLFWIISVISAICLSITLCVSAQTKIDDGKVMIIKKSDKQPEPTPTPVEEPKPSKPEETKPTVAPADAQVVSLPNDEPVRLKDEVAQTDEEKAILPIYQNYLTDYRLGPKDVISIEVFGQCPAYCIEGKAVPPNAKLSYPLIGSVFVAGKTTEQIEAEIAKRLDEYIISPSVSVTIEQANSARYSVLGKVLTPGVRVMDRKVSVYEAIIESGGVLKEGDEKRITIFSYNSKGLLEQKNFDLSVYKAGKAEPIYLQPGDQVFVPDAKFKFNLSTIGKILEKASIFRLLLGSPF
jgi:polysaccharide biosynthesis/export protein